MLSENRLRKRLIVFVGLLNDSDGTLRILMWTSFFDSDLANIFEHGGGLNHCDYKCIATSDRRCTI
ncbi:unnamed protein product [Anisakis simplex]|uniref:Uncharacterized protein n=1 Tax=Anisakis simplex TaxID=6269 RepID=A0A0M3J5D3_ANISI|nr:unnamed protein product [Anisakis simplex]